MRFIKGFLSNSDISVLIELEQKYSYSFQPGRQGSGYFKLNLLDSMIPSDIVGLVESIDIFRRSLKEVGYLQGNKWDSYLIRYPIGSSIPPHRDRVGFGLEHHRINAIVKQGEFTKVNIDNVFYGSIETGDAYIFRPDLQKHSVPKITDSERLVFSLGLIK